jgi:hypothetical protein
MVDSKIIKTNPAIAFGQNREKKMPFVFLVIVP